MHHPLLTLPSDADPDIWEMILLAADNPNSLEGIRSSALGRICFPLINIADSRRPLVFAQIGQSLDGRIATASGKSHFINGKEAIRHLHRMRALAEAVVIGVGTALSDDPQLTVREVSGRNPARVIIDPGGRLPATSRCLRDDGTRRIVLQSKEFARPSGVEAFILPAPDGRIDPNTIIKTLAGLGFQRILIEGGATTVSRFLDAGRLARLHLLIAPIIIGSGPTGLSLAAIDELTSALRPSHMIYRFGDGDLLVDCNFDVTGGVT